MTGKATPKTPVLVADRAKMDERTRYCEAAKRHPDALFSLTGRQLAAMLQQG